MRFIKKIIKKIKGIDVEYSYNIYENGEFELMKKISKLKFKEIFDVGCHYGEWSLALSNLTEENKIHTFEISYSNFKILEKKLNKNKFINNNCGLSCTDGMIDYKDYGDGSQINTLIVQSVFHDDHSKFNIKKTNVRSGDTYCKEKNIKFIDFLKIDTEGSEHLVLQGFSNMLSQNNIRLIQFEYGYANGYAKFLMKDFFNFFMNKNYIVAKLRKKIKFEGWNDLFNDFNSGPNYIAISKDDFEIKSILEKN